MRAAVYQERERTKKATFSALEKYSRYRDTVSRSEKMSEELRLHYLKNITDLLSHTFTSQFVFPVLGHEDLGLPLSVVAQLWGKWLPGEAITTFAKCQYIYNYTIYIHNTYNRYVYIIYILIYKK